MSDEEVLQPAVRPEPTFDVDTTCSHCGHKQKLTTLAHGTRVDEVSCRNCGQRALEADVAV
jgi:transcription elongation factor Elf1